MADPAPSLGLPEFEYVELTNRSGQPIPLMNWSLTDGNSRAFIRTPLILLPDSLLILCAPGAVGSLQRFGSAVGLAGFPSLNNDGDQLVLLDPEGSTIHAVAYDISWYRQSPRQSGGLALEMADLRSPCTDSVNWHPSNDPLGGTPGRPNSRRTSNPDVDAPQLLLAHAPDSQSLVLVFNESVDSSQAINPRLYHFAEHPDLPSQVRCQPPFFREIRLTLPFTLQPGRKYLVYVTRVADCAGNSSSEIQQTPAGLARAPNVNDIVINEVLFKASTDGGEYVELLNRSNQILDLAALYLSVQGAGTGSPQFVACSSVPFPVFPGDFITFSRETHRILEKYQIPRKQVIRPLPDLPKLSDEGGEIRITDAQGRLIDQMRYNDQLHHPLLADTRDVSLEKINPAGSGMEAVNWYSAASTVGYGTPAAVNSQFKEADTVAGDWKVDLAFFSPDQDGRDDLLTISYQMPEPGYSASILIIASHGIPVRIICRNVLLGHQGQFRWNGLDQFNRQLPPGVYYVKLEYFNLRGRRKTNRYPVVMAKLR